MKRRTQYGYRAVAALLVLSIAAGLCGCVPQNQPAANNPPTANAGPAQTVLPSAAVTLTGASSSDPDGDTLTYAWAQVLGATVTLTGATTVSPTFTAPTTNATLVFQLTVSDGQGETSSAMVTILVVAGGGTSPVTPTLFVTSAAGPNVVGFAYPWTVSGNTVPNTVLTGTATKLVMPWAAVAISNGTLLVSNIDGTTDGDSPSITGYVNASSATGNLAPSVEVTGAATSLVSPRAMAYHATTDSLLVADVGTPSILVYANVSQPAFNGNVPPTRIITSGDLAGPQGIYLASNGDLYVANNGNNSIAVFANAHAANGTVAATRLITSTELAAAGALQAVCVDTSDHLFAADSGGKVFMFNSASTLTGAATAAATIQIQTTLATSLTAIAVDSGGHGYVLDGGANSAVYVYDSIATRSGTLPPDRKITGNATQLVLPQRLFFWE